MKFAHACLEPSTICTAPVNVTSPKRPKIESLRWNPEWLIYFLWYSFVGMGPRACIAWTLLMIVVVLVFVRNPKEK